MLHARLRLKPVRGTHSLTNGLGRDQGIGRGPYYQGCRLTSFLLGLENGAIRDDAVLEVTPKVNEQPSGDGDDAYPSRAFAIAESPLEPL